jgi:hypothetical protein
MHTHDYRQLHTTTRNLYTNAQSHPHILPSPPTHRVVVGKEYYEPQGLEPEVPVEAALAMLLAQKVPRTRTPGAMLASSQFPAAYFSVGGVEQWWAGGAGPRGGAARGGPLRGSRGRGSGGGRLAWRVHPCLAAPRRPPALHANRCGVAQAADIFIPLDSCSGPDSSPGPADIP